MDDLTKQQGDLIVDVWDRVGRLERRLGSLRDALQAVGPGASVTLVAGVVAEEAVNLLAAAAKADGYGDAVSRM